MGSEYVQDAGFNRDDGNRSHGPGQAVMRRHPVLAFLIFAIAAAVLVSAIVAAAQGNGGSSGANAGAPSSAPSAAPGPAPDPAASTACTTDSCISVSLQRSLVGLVAKDDSVITGATCYAQTVKRNAGNTYTARCHVTYSDGTEYAGFATLLVAQGEVSWEPEEELQ
jgi:hypothetical protein